MLGSFKEKFDSNSRSELIAEFNKVVTTLNAADPSARVAVGHGVNLANALLLQKFSGLNGFLVASREGQLEHLRQLRSAEEVLAIKDAQVALGFGLFKMWVAALIENDKELIDYFGQELAKFSKEGELPI